MQVKNEPAALAYFGCYFPFGALLLAGWVFVLWRGVVEPMGAALALGEFQKTHFEPNVMSHYVDQTGCFRPAALVLFGVLLIGLVAYLREEFLLKQHRYLPEGFVLLEQYHRQRWAELTASPDVRGLLVNADSPRERKSRLGLGSGLTLAATLFSSAMLPELLTQEADPNRLVYTLGITSFLALAWLGVAWKIFSTPIFHHWICISFSPFQMEWVNRKPGQRGWEETRSIQPKALKIQLDQRLFRLQIEEENTTFELMNGLAPDGDSSLEDFARALSRRTQLELLF